MHPSCIKNAEQFVNEFLDTKKAYKVLDVGSFNINGTLRPLFTPHGCICRVCGKVERTQSPLQSCCENKKMKPGWVCDGVSWRPLALNAIGDRWEYFGMDLASSCKPYGDVINDPARRRYNVDILMDDPHKYPLENNSFDIIVSTSCLEHDSAFWLTFNEMVRVVAPGGFIYINCPSNGPYHGFPDDCWRFQKDAYKALAEWNPNAKLLKSYIDDDVQLHGGWADNIGIFQVQ